MIMILMMVMMRGMIMVVSIRKEDGADGDYGSAYDDDENDDQDGDNGGNSRRLCSFYCSGCVRRFVSCITNFRSGTAVQSQGIAAELARNCLSGKLARDCLNGKSRDYLSGKLA